MREGLAAGACFNEAAAHHRGERAPAVAGVPETGGFNEAAAHHRGERTVSGNVVTQIAASMRPRLITAENAPRDAQRANYMRASMRPRLITAENDVDRCRSADGALASMRPRLITAENEEQVGGEDAQAQASMRPRLITAENLTGRSGSGSGSPRFNEAAAHHRGEPWRR